MACAAPQFGQIGNPASWPSGFRPFKATLKLGFNFLLAILILLARLRD